LETEQRVSLRHVAQAFQPAGSGDIPVASFSNMGLESPVNPQTGMSALRCRLEGPYKPEHYRY
jgi:hypothetical protein